MSLAIFFEILSLWTWSSLASWRIVSSFFKQLETQASKKGILWSSILSVGKVKFKSGRPIVYAGHFPNTTGSHWQLSPNKCWRNELFHSPEEKKTNGAGLKPKRMFLQSKIRWGMWNETLDFIFANWAGMLSKPTKGPKDNLFQEVGCNNWLELTMG